jgi:hypothetical protein
MCCRDKDHFIKNCKSAVQLTSSMLSLLETVKKMTEEENFKKVALAEVAAESV